jgi:hypothetical protein
MAAGMKKVFRTALTDIKTTDFEGVGTLRFEGDKVYKWVQFSGTTAVTAGKMVCYNLTAGANLYGVVVDGANSNLGAGIAQVSIGTGTVYYGWIQVQGFAVFAGTTTGAAGNPLSTVGATAGNLLVVAAVTSQTAALLIDATNSYIFVTCPM